MNSNVGMGQRIDRRKVIFILCTCAWLFYSCRKFLADFRSSSFYGSFPHEILSPTRILVSVSLRNAWVFAAFFWLLYCSGLGWLVAFNFSSLLQSCSLLLFSFSFYFASNPFWNCISFPLYFFQLQSLSVFDIIFNDDGLLIILLNWTGHEINFAVMVLHRK